MAHCVRKEERKKKKEGGRGTRTRSATLSFLYANMR